jgi:hypothetical protein
LKPGKCRQASPFTPSKEVVAVRDVRKQGKEGGGDVFVNTATLAWLYTTTRRNYIKGRVMEML